MSGDGWHRGFSDGVPAYPVEERADGVYVQVPELAALRHSGTIRLQVTPGGFGTVTEPEIRDA